jgi:hypothetical protein
MIGGAFLHTKHISPPADLVKMQQELLVATENIKKYLEKGIKII